MENDLEREIFGSDDELSSPDEEDIQEKSYSAPSGPQAVYESSGDSGDDYVQEKRQAKSREGGRGRRSQRIGEGGPKGAKTPRQPKRKRKEIEEVDISQLPPAQANRLKLDMKIDAILKPNRASKPRRKKKDDDDVLDRFADETVARLKEDMFAAAHDDEQAKREKRPATSKLKMLPRVMDVMRKNALTESIIDNNLLEAVTRWLKPSFDRSLPALDIQKEFFPALKRMDIDTGALKEARLGPVVLFYTKCKRVTPDIQRHANDLVSAWSRPIIKRSASYRDRVIPVANMPEEGARTGGERLNAILARAKEGEKNRVRKNAVMIPQRELGSYTIAPHSSAVLGRNSMSVDVDIERRKKNAERLRSLTRKIASKT